MEEWSTVLTYMSVIEQKTGTITVYVPANINNIFSIFYKLPDFVLSDVTLAVKHGS